jgi:outer membrane protein OmpA-like peptidoglycan-associated protein
MGYELPLGGGMLLMPEFRYYLPVTHVSNALWKASSFQFGMALKAPIFPEKDLPVIRDTIITRDTTIIAERGATPRVELDDRDVDEITEESTDRILERTIVTEKYNKYVPKKMDLAASVRAVGISAEGERQENPTIVIEETEVSESFPVLPYVFFPEGSSELSATAMHLLKPEGTSSFVEDSLPWNTLDIYSEMLNIVGSRMKKNPDAKIVVTGCNNNTGVETKNLPLSKARAGAVKDYLVYVWGIDEERILAQQRNLPANPGNTQYTEGQVENQRAEISSRDFDIIQPVKLRDIQKTSNPPNVEIYPEITAEAGIAGWNLRVLQKEQTLREYTGESRPNMINWEVENAPIPALDTPLELNLWAADKDGQTTEATDQLEIRQLTIRKKRYELQDDKRIERFSLIVFDYDKAKLTENHKKILRKINERIQPDSKVTISGYADRTGDREYNRVLAYRRCMEVREELDITESNLKLNPVGSDILLYDNDTPQGRSYSRTVQIVVETPVR